jgi:hypothetical protein
MGLWPLDSLKKNNLNNSIPGINIIIKISSAKNKFLLYESIKKKEIRKPNNMEPLLPKKHLFWEFK